MVIRFDPPPPKLTSTNTWIPTSASTAWVLDKVHAYQQVSLFQASICTSCPVACYLYIHGSIHDTVLFLSNCPWYKNITFIRPQQSVMNVVWSFLYACKAPSGDWSASVREHSYMASNEGFHTVDCLREVYRRQNYCLSPFFSCCSKTGRLKEDGRTTQVGCKLSDRWQSPWRLEAYTCALSQIICKWSCI
jgi:hypothetical protein